MEDEIKELSRIIGKDVEELYEHVLYTAFCQIISDGKIIPVTRVICDIESIRDSNPQGAQLLTTLMCNPMQTYQTLGNKMGIKKQLVYYRLECLAWKFPWLKTMMEIRSWYFHHGGRRKKEVMKKRK